jgi:hypothetical protein
LSPARPALASEIGSRDSASHTARRRLSTPESKRRHSSLAEPPRLSHRCSSSMATISWPDELPGHNHGRAGRWRGSAREDVGRQPCQGRRGRNRPADLAPVEFRTRPRHRPDPGIDWLRRRSHIRWPGRHSGGRAISPLAIRPKPPSSEANALTDPCRKGRYWSPIRGTHHLGQLSYPRTRLGHLLKTNPIG